MSGSAIKPCKCGSIPFLRYKQEVKDKLEFEKYRVTCSRCNIKTKWEPFPDLAIATWNIYVTKKEKGD